MAPDAFEPRLLVLFFFEFMFRIEMVVSQKRPRLGTLPDNAHFMRRRPQNLEHAFGKAMGLRADGAHNRAVRDDKIRMKANRD